MSIRKVNMLEYGNLKSLDMGKNKNYKLSRLLNEVTEYILRDAAKGECDIDGLAEICSKYHGKFSRISIKQIQENSTSLLIECIEDLHKSPRKAKNVEKKTKRSSITRII